MAFCTVINCMDGRVQLPVIEFLQKRFQAEYVDSITEAGPARFFDGDDEAVLQSILTRVDVSVNRHDSKFIAVCSHAGCAGNPAPDDVQQQQVVKAVAFLKDRYPDVKVVGLWVDFDWQIHEQC